MKKRPSIINMARGAIIETSALVNALKVGRIRGACLDVVDPEPIRRDPPLLTLKNCLIVPHIGTATVEFRYTMAKWAAENIPAHFLGKKMVFPN